MCDNWPDKIFGDVISVPAFHLFVASMPNRHEKSQCTRKNSVESVPRATVSSSHRSADLSVQSPRHDNYRDEYSQL